MIEYSDTEQPTPKEVTNPLELMTLFLHSNQYMTAYETFRNSRIPNPNITEDRYMIAFNGQETTRYLFIDFVKDSIRDGSFKFIYDSNKYPPTVAQALKNYIDHVADVEKKNRYVRDADAAEFDEQMRISYHTEASSEIYLNNLAPSPELARGLAQVILYATGHDSLDSAKYSSLARARFSLS
jgi:hypothetical protein